METILILIGIVVLDALIKKKAKKSKQSKQLPPQDISQQEHDNAEENHEKPRSLQDLIRQFDEAQRDAAQGTYVPPTPPIEENIEEEEELPVVPPANPGQFSFIEIAESVIQWEEVCIEYLQQAFGFSEEVAAKVLFELQKHNIVGHDMGDGFCDVLIHDKVELENLFKQQNNENEKSKIEKQRQIEKLAEIEHQRKLNELEARARELREKASKVINPSSEPSTVQQKALLSTKNIEEIRRGFLWAKVIDEPRYKKRWSAHMR